MAYDPGRYYAAAALMMPWANDGILALRAALALVQSLAVCLLRRHRRLRGRRHFLGHARGGTRDDGQDQRHQKKRGPDGALDRAGRRREGILSRAPERSGRVIEEAGPRSRSGPRDSRGHAPAADLDRVPGPWPAKSLECSGTIRREPRSRPGMNPRLAPLASTPRRWLKRASGTRGAARNGRPAAFAGRSPGSGFRMWVRALRMVDGVRQLAMPGPRSMAHTHDPKKRPPCIMAENLVSCLPMNRFRSERNAGRPGRSNRIDLPLRIPRNPSLAREQA